MVLSPDVSSVSPLVNSYLVYFLLYSLLTSINPWLTTFVTTGSLKHPNVIKLLDIISGVDEVDLIYEFLPRDLRTVLDEKFSSSYLPCPATCDQQIKHYYKQILEGVNFLHSRLILHRPVVPLFLVLTQFCWYATICDPSSRSQL